MSFENAKLYLARVLHWPDANEEPAYGNVHWTFKKAGEDKVLWTGRACRSVKDAVNAIDWALNKSSGTLDVYACLSTQRNAQEKVSAKGFKYYTPIRNQGNAVALKCLFIDIDLKGGDNGYSNGTEAATALNAFLAATNMPKPTMIVASGGGFHVYWTLMRALRPEEWQPLAFALAEATKQHGLKCDTQCTVDSARILRIPDTFNCKQNPKRLVNFVGEVRDFDYAIERIEKALAPYKNPNFQPVAILPQLTPLHGVSDLAAGVELYKAEPIPLRAVALECPFVRHAVMTGGKDYANPLWNMTTFISTFLENGRDAAHLMAKSHGGYTKESTDELYDRKVKEQQQKNLGWPSCVKISSEGCTLCQTCPHYSAGKSPLNFSRPAPTPVAAPAPLPPADQSDMPRGYRRMPGGEVVRLVTGLDGATTEVPVLRYPLINAELENNMGKSILHFWTRTENGQMSKIAIPFGCINTQEMRRVLQEQGMILPRRLEEFGDFMEAWVRTLQATRQSVKLITFGWSLDNKANIEGFVYGDKLWTPSGSRDAATKASRLAQHYTPRGDIQRWYDAMKIITDQKRPQIEALVLSSFAAPLVRFSGHTGLILSGYSLLSGKGKTTAMNIGQAVWGNPVHKFGLDDTANKAGGAMADLHSLPLMWDELKDEAHIRSIVNMIYRVTDQGREKGRMNSDTSFRDSGEFQSLMVVASNDSLLEWADQNTQLTDATFLRIFEFEVPDPTGVGRLDPNFVQRTVAHLRDHYGVMGLEYAKWLGVHHARVAKEVGDYITSVNTRTSAEPEERFWTSTIGVIMMAAKYVNENKWATIDEEALEAFLFDTLTKLRADRAKRPGDMSKTINAVELMEQYLSSQLARHTLITNRINQGRGRVTVGSIKVLSDVSRLDGIHVQIGRDDKIVRIHNHHFRQWLADMKYRPNKTMQMLHDQFGLKDIVGSLGSGTIHSTPPIKLKEIDLTGQGVALNFLDV